MAFTDLMFLNFKQNIFQEELELYNSYTAEMEVMRTRISALSATLSTSDPKAKDPADQEALEAAQARFNELHDTRRELAFTVSSRFTSWLVEHPEEIINSTLQNLGQMTTDEYIQYMAPGVSMHDTFYPPGQEPVKSKGLTYEKDADGKEYVILSYTPPEWQLKYCARSAYFWISSFALREQISVIYRLYGEELADEDGIQLPKLKRRRGKHSRIAEEFVRIVTNHCNTLAEEALAYQEYKQLQEAALEEDEPAQDESSQEAEAAADEPQQEVTADSSQADKEEEPAPGQQIMDGLQFFAEPQGPQPVSQEDTYKQFSLFDTDFFPIFQDRAVTDITFVDFREAKKSIVRNKITNESIATIHTDNGTTFTIEDCDNMISNLGVSAIKLVHTAIGQLTQTNTWNGSDADLEHINPTVYIDLMEYFRANGFQVDPRIISNATPAEMEREQKRAQDNVRQNKRKIKQDIIALSNVRQTWTQTNGKNSGDFKLKRLISSGGVEKGVIKINFDPEAAIYLSRAYIMQFPKALLRIDNTSANAYKIGIKLSQHYGMDNNYKRGNYDVLSVVTLISAAQAISTFEELAAAKRRDWKTQIRAKLESALAELVSVGFLERWEYTDRGRHRYTLAEVDKLRESEYKQLNVAFIVKDFPEQERAARLQKKQDAAALEDAEQKSRRKADATAGKKKPGSRKKAKPQ